MPELSKEVIANLRLGHGLFGLAVIVLFLVQGWHGLTIRRARKAGAPVPLETVRKHRKRGPVLIVLTAAALLGGLGVATVNERDYLEHVPHLAAGIAILALGAGAAVIGGRIQGPDPGPRTVHAAVGLALLTVALFQALLGVGILL